jgi:hypothetical protein
MDNDFGLCHYVNEGCFADCLDSFTMSIFKVK